MDDPARVSTVALVVFVFGLVLGSASPHARSAGSRSTFVFAQAAEADTLDCPITVNNQTGEVCVQIFNGLVRTKPGTLEIEPDLATAWSVSPDGLVWTFKLRGGVAFQDGTPWNAMAAKVNVDRWANKQNPVHQQNATFFFWDALIGDSFKEARAINPDTFQLMLEQPDSPLITNLAIPTFAFASPEALRKYGGAGVGQHAVGTGPYMLVEWIRGDHLTLQANRAFFRRGLPKTERVIYRVIPDSSARYLALKAGEVDAMELPTPNDLKTARNDPQLKIGLRPALSTAWIEFGLNRPDSPFKDVRVRRAVALAINKDVIVRELYGGLGEPATQYLPPIVWGRVPHLPGYPYDPAGARKLLADAGYPSGFETDFWYLPVARPYSPVSKEIAEAIANDLSKVGIRTRLVTEDFAAYLKDIFTSTKVPFYMIGRTGLTGDPDDWFGPLFSHYNPTSTRWSYNNPTVFQLVRTAEVLTRQPQRAKAYQDIENILYRDVVQVPLAHSKSPLLMRTNVEDLVPHPTTFEYMETVVVK